MAQISLTSTMLRRIVKVVAPATATKPIVPTHFSETMRVRPMEGGLLFTCCDGFRLHEVEMFRGMINYWGDGDLVLGVGWLQDILKECGRTERWLEISAEAHPDTKTFVEMWEARAYMAPLYDATSDQPRNDHPQRFDIGGKWPRTESLIGHGDVQDGVGFNPVYFKDMVTAAMAWWDKDTRDDAFPLVVQEMAPQKLSTFTLRNAMGRLRVVIMPKVMKDEEI